MSAGVIEHPGLENPGSHVEPELRPDGAGSCPSSPSRKEPLAWAARLVTDDPNAAFSELGRRAATGLGLSAVYGVALGVRHGGRSLFQHALGVPAGILIVGLVGAPAMFVFLSLFRAPIDARALSSTAARGVAAAGILLAGLAPAAALFVVSSGTPEAAAGAVTLGLWLGGGVALGRMVGDVSRRALAGKTESVLGGLIVAGVFALFAAALSARVWNAVLPILGGAS